MSKPKLGSGARFKNVQKDVAMGYMKKGMSKMEAMKIGGAVAAEQGRKKFGAKKMSLLAKRGKKS